MSTVIYLANQHIQVVTGSPGEKKISVTGSYEAEAPEGSIINGIIMDTELFVSFMKEFWSANRLPSKDVILVLNSSKFAGKIIEMPELNVKKTYQFISREFSDSNRDENYLYSYLPLGIGEGKMKRVYAESVEPDFIKDYVDIFREIGISLKSIVSSESSIIGLTAMTTGKKYKTFALIIADSSILTTILWINGSFYYFNSVRSFHEKDTDDYAGDVARSVSQIVQFMQAHQIEQQLESIVIAGINNDTFPMYVNAVEQMGISAPVQIYETGNMVASGRVDIQNCLHATSGLMISSRYLDFLKQYTETSGRNKEKKSKSIGINFLPIIVAAGVMAVLVITAEAVLLIRKNTLNDVKEYNENPAVMNSVLEYDMMTGRNKFLSSQYNAIKAIDENLSTYPIFDSRVMAQIDACATGYATVSFNSFDAENGTVQMTASSDTVEDINCFIKKLTEQDIFNSVDYTGYTYNDTTSNWDIHVTCTLAESAGR